MRFHCSATNFERSSLMGRKSCQWYTVRQVSCNSAGFNAFTTLPWLDHPHSCDDTKHVHPIHLRVTFFSSFSFKVLLILIGVTNRTAIDTALESPDPSKTCPSSWLFSASKTISSPIPKRNTPQQSKKSPTNTMHKFLSPHGNDFKQCIFPKLISNKSSPKPVPLAPGIPSWKPSEPSLGAVHELTRSCLGSFGMTFWERSE